jgi:hypothetical protein
MAMKFSIPFMRHLLYAQFTNAEAGHWLRLARTDFAMASISSRTFAEAQRPRFGWFVAQSEGPRHATDRKIFVPVNASCRDHVVSTATLGKSMKVITVASPKQFYTVFH